MHRNCPGWSNCTVRTALGRQGFSSLRRPTRVLPLSPELRGGSSGPWPGQREADLRFLNAPRLGQRGVQTVFPAKSALRAPGSRVPRQGSCAHGRHLTLVAPLENLPSALGETCWEPTGGRVPSTSAPGLKP